MSIIRTETRLCGVKKLAAELGISRFHLGAVLNGRRKPGPKLAAALKERHIKVPKLRKAGERWV